MKGKIVRIIIIILIVICIAICGGVVITKNNDSKKNEKKYEQEAHNNVNENNESVDNTTADKEYTKIEFTKFAVKSGENISIEKNEKSKFEINDKIVSINGKETVIETDSDKIYVVDLDNDGISEVISYTRDDRISPPTNNYHIYKINYNEEFEEAVNISIMGSIDVLYVKGRQIRIEYEPYEAKPGTIVRGNYRI